MLTAAQIAQLTDEDRTQLFERLVASVFETQVETCAALGIGRSTLHNWRKDRNAPAMAVLAMQSIAVAPTRPAALLMDARAIAAQIETSAGAMAEAAKLMASVVRRMPDDAA